MLTEVVEKESTSFVDLALKPVKDIEDGVVKNRYQRVYRQKIMSFLSEFSGGSNGLQDGYASLLSSIKIMFPADFQKLKMYKDLYRRLGIPGHYEDFGALLGGFQMDTTPHIPYFKSRRIFWYKSLMPEVGEIFPPHFPVPNAKKVAKHIHKLPSRLGDYRRYSGYLEMAIYTAILNGGTYLHHPNGKKVVEYAGTLLEEKDKTREEYLDAAALLKILGHPKSNELDFRTRSWWFCETDFHYQRAFEQVEPSGEGITRFSYDLLLGGILGAEKANFTNGSIQLIWPWEVVSTKIDNLPQRRKYAN